MRGGRGSASPGTFKISYIIYVGILSSQILFSLTNPFPLGIVSSIISPLSYTCNFHLATYLYTSYLLMYYVFEREILHFISPLCFLMPSYGILRLTFHAHSKTNLCSPGGAFTLMQPVHMIKSSFRCVYRASFYCSLSPL